MKLKIPNILTIGRIVLVPIFIFTFYLPGFLGDLIPFIIFLLASFTQIEYVIFGVIAALAIYVGRIMITHSVLVRGFSKLDKKVTSVMIPRGLAAAVLATFPLSMGLPNAEAYPQIIFFVVITSVIITTIGLGGAKKIPPPESQSGGYVKEKK